MCTNCNLPNGAPDEAFGERLMGMMNEAALALMLSVGHRTGLFDAMAGLGPSSVETIASAAELQPRYVREWLGAMTTGRIVDHDGAAGTYHLPGERAALLTRSAAPENMAAFMQWVSVLGGVETKIVRAFREGGGVGYAEYERFAEVMSEESGQTVVAALEPHVLPLVPDVVERLEVGIDVLDVGCGSGRAAVRLAELFPASRFTGYDLMPDAIASARAEAAHRGVANARFEVRDVAEPFGEKAFDLITTFDAVHDQARPDLVLANIERALRGGGTYLMQDIAARTAHGDNMDHPLGPLIYTISCMHCMTVSLSQGGMGLGAAWGREKALQMLAEAGFEGVKVHQLEHDVQNYWYVMQKSASHSARTEARTMGAGARG